METVRTLDLTSFESATPNIAQPAAAAPPIATAAPSLAAGAGGQHSGAEQEAEAALRYLEAEWAMRMEAPLSALTELEISLTHAIDEATRALPKIGEQDHERRRILR